MSEDSKHGEKNTAEIQAEATRDAAKTQAAAARATSLTQALALVVVALITALTSIVVSKRNSSNPEVTSYPSFTSIPIATLTFSPISIPTSNLCPYQDQTDHDTIVQLIRAEATAVNSEDLEIILKIFSPDAEFYDYAQKDPKTQKEPRKWNGPRDRYQYDLFPNTEFQGVQHVQITPVGPRIDGNVAYYVSGSMGSYSLSSDQWTPFNNPSIPDEPNGSDHWVLQKDKGCWVITKMEFNAGHIKFP